MNILIVVNNDVQLHVSYDELLILNSVLNEICNGIDTFEFDTRIGATKKRVFSILEQIGTAINKIEKGEVGWNDDSGSSCTEKASTKETD